jgi:GNAT superfamily N-acetyltransferase
MSQGQKPVIRVGAMEDLATAAFLAFMEFWEERAYMTGMNFNFHSTVATLAKPLETPGSGELVVADVDGVVVGFLLAGYQPNPMDHEQPVCHEIGWFVRPDMRGRGIGWGMIDELQRRAAARGVLLGSLGVAVTSDNHDVLLESYREKGYIAFQTMCFTQFRR